MRVRRKPIAGWEPAQCAFHLHGVSELADDNRKFSLAARDFASVNPNTGTAPIFRTRRDAELTTAIYRRLPVLVDRTTGREIKTWPVKYTTMFHMTNDPDQFRTREELEEREGAWPVGANLFESGEGKWLPLYEGKMVQAFDHRAASIVVNPENLHRPAQPLAATEEQRSNPNWLPNPQYWVQDINVAVPYLNTDAEEDGDYEEGLEDEREFPRWWVGWKDVTAPTNIRTVIASIIPRSGVGNTFPIFLPESNHETFVACSPLILANLNATTLDYIARQKVQGQHLNWYIVEQLPVVPLARYVTVRFGPKTAAEIVGEAVLELTYTAHDMAAFAQDQGYVDDTGAARPPFGWNEERRLRLRAKLDAVYFHLYGVTSRDDVRYVYSTFPIVEREEIAAYGRYRTRDLCLAWMNALAAGRPDAEPDA